MGRPGLIHHEARSDSDVRLSHTRATWDFRSCSFPCSMQSHFSRSAIETYLAVLALLYRYLKGEDIQCMMYTVPVIRFELRIDEPKNRPPGRIFSAARRCAGLERPWFKKVTSQQSGLPLTGGNRGLSLRSKSFSEVSPPYHERICHIAP